MTRHSRLRARRAVLEKWLDSNRLSHTLSASRYLLHAEVRSAIAAEAGGRILEVGAGASPFMNVLRERGDEVVTLDIEDRQGGVHILGDVQDLDQVESPSFDTILSTQVLEHVRSPSRAFTEMAKVLKPGEILILSAPRLSMIHEEPHDYSRFTNYGPGALCLDSGVSEPQVRITSEVYPTDHLLIARRSARVGI